MRITGYRASTYFRDGARTPKFIILFLAAAILSIAGQGQSNPGSTRIPGSFAVASIKPDNSGRLSNFLHSRGDLEGIAEVNATLRNLIMQAYVVHAQQIAGTPSWAKSAYYDIEAKVDESDLEILRALTYEQRIQARQTMLQNLLADRFRLRIHRETRKLPVYALVVARGGPKFDAKSVDTPNPRNSYGISERDAPLDNFAKNLTSRIDRIVIDQTGLTGRYTFKFWWTPDLDPRSTREPDGPSLITALHEQLDLKLKPEKAPIEMIVIDHVEPPSPN
jgi:uncharacterized protein (TIGR03435 family)